MNERTRTRLGILALALIFFLDCGIETMPRYAELAAGVGLEAIGALLIVVGVGRVSRDFLPILFLFHPALMLLFVSAPSLRLVPTSVGLIATTVAVLTATEVTGRLVPRLGLRCSIGVMAGALLGTALCAPAVGRLGLGAWLVVCVALSATLGLMTWRSRPAMNGGSGERISAEGSTDPRLVAIAVLAIFSLMAAGLGPEWELLYRDGLHLTVTDCGYAGLLVIAYFVGFVFFEEQLAEHLGRPIARVGVAVWSRAIGSGRR